MQKHSTVEVLGCSGSIGIPRQGTTSFLIDSDILIDAGTGVGDLSIAELSRIDHVFVTHSHLDHIACLPLMVDTVGELRDTPLTVWTTAPTLEVLRRHIFNWSFWPDFTEISAIIPLACGITVTASIASPSPQPTGTPPTTIGTTSTTTHSPGTTTTTNTQPFKILTKNLKIKKKYYFCINNIIITMATSFGNINLYEIFNK